MVAVLSSSTRVSSKTVFCCSVAVSLSLFIYLLLGVEVSYEYIKKQVTDLTHYSITTTSNEYSYPDQSDGGIWDYVLTLESREQEDGGDPEITAWRTIDKYLLNRTANVPVSNGQHSNTAMLDAGCGQGRNMIRYCAQFTVCTGIDADERRVQMAKDALQNSQTVKNTVFHVTGAHVFQTPKHYDFILNSMVLQHVSHVTAAKIVRNLVSLLQPAGGILVVLTTFHPRAPFYHSMCVGSNNFLCDFDNFKVISAHQFEADTATPQPNRLPVHYWTPYELRTLLTNAGCKVIDTFVFTYYKPASRTQYFAEYVSMGDFLFQQKFGLSIDEFFQSPVSQGMICTATASNLRHL